MRNRPGAAIARFLSHVLIVSGLLLLTDAALTVTWQEPVSAVYSRLQQDRLEGRLADLEGPTPLERKALSALKDDRSRMAFRARTLSRKARPGQAIGRVRIPKIDVSSVFVEGTGTKDLRLGPGHYPDTPLPGMAGTVGIAGHRTTYGAPFRRVDRLRRGDRIEVVMPYGTFRYEVEKTRIVAPTAVEVVRRVDHDRLVLTACHPLYSAAQRIVIFARLREARPAGGLI